MDTLLYHLDIMHVLTPTSSTTPDVDCTTPLYRVRNGTMNKLSEAIAIVVLCFITLTDRQ